MPKYRANIWLVGDGDDSHVTTPLFEAGSVDAAHVHLWNLIQAQDGLVYGEKSHGFAPYHAISAWAVFEEKDPGAD